LPGALERGDELPRRIADWVSGMTDRYCLRVLRETFMPREWPFQR
jgi:dGTP triphosphohydrolase